MVEEWRLSVCGLNCAACDIYRASHGDEAERARIIAWFKEKRGIDLKPGQVRCDGCRCPPERNWSDDCAMQRCAAEKGHRYCFECEGFPCRHTDAFANDGTVHHAQTIKNLHEIRRVGLENWLRGRGPEFCPG